MSGPHASRESSFIALPRDLAREGEAAGDGSPASRTPARPCVADVEDPHVWAPCVKEVQRLPHAGGVRAALAGRVVALLDGGRLSGLEDFSFGGILRPGVHVGFAGGGALLARGDRMPHVSARRREGHDELPRLECSTESVSDVLRCVNDLPRLLLGSPLVPPPPSSSSCLSALASRIA